MEGYPGQNNHIEEERKIRRELSAARKTCGADGDKKEKKLLKEMVIAIWLLVVPDIVLHWNNYEPS